MENFQIIPRKNNETCLINTFITIQQKIRTSKLKTVIEISVRQLVSLKDITDEQQFKITWQSFVSDCCFFSVFGCLLIADRENKKRIRSRTFLISEFSTTVATVYKTKATEQWKF